MKKIIWILLFVLILAVIAGVVFVATLDVNQYRPLLMDQIQKAIGKPVRIEKISLGWRSGAALSLNGFAVAADPEFRDKLIEVDSAKAELQLMPLLAREIKVSSIYIGEPKIRIVRKPDGTLLGFEPTPAGASEVNAAEGNHPPVNPAQAGAALSFLVDEIRVDSGDILFRDESGAHVKEIRVRDFDLRIGHASLDQPIPVELKAAFLSRRQNIQAEGELKFISRSRELVLEKFKAEMNLEDLDLQELYRLAPEASASGLEQIKGTASLQTQGRIVLNEKALLIAAGSFDLRDGALKLETLPAPVENIRVDLGLQSGLVKIRQAAASFARGTLNVSGQVNLKTPKPLTALTLALKDLSLADAVSAPRNSSEPFLEGNLSGGFQGTFTGTSAPEVQNSLSGEGQLVLERGVIRNLNILREVFKKLSMIPGLMDTLSRRLPADYQEKLDAPDTHFNTIQAPLAVRDGAVGFNPISVQTDSFAIQGGGSYHMPTATVGAQANLFIEPQLSAALIRSVNELEYLTDRNSGTLMVPLNIQGRAPQISVMPDLQYIASRLAVAKLGSLFKKPQETQMDPMTGQPVSSSDPNAGQQGLSDSQASAPAKTKLPKGSAILGALLQSALQPQGDGSGGTSSDSGNQQQGSGFLF